MEEQSYTSTHPLGHTGPVTGSLYLYELRLPVFDNKIGTRTQFGLLHQLRCSVKFAACKYRFWNCSVQITDFDEILMHTETISTYA
jgi:hypothetical protein